MQSNPSAGPSLRWLLGLLLFATALAVRAQERVPASFGTGFVVSDQGHVVTAHHVIRDKSQVLVGPFARNRWVVAQVVHVDPGQDLALLKARLTLPPLPIADWREVPIGIEAIVIGYPQPGLLGLSKKITQGIVNGDRRSPTDVGHFQLSAEVQKGNSGGPVLGPDGAVIGVVQKKLDALSIAEKTRDLPQNVNYALKSAVLKTFLDAAGLDVPLRSPDLSAAPRAYEVFRRTEASIVAIVGRTAPVDAAIVPTATPGEVRVAPAAD